MNLNHVRFQVLGRFLYIKTAVSHTGTSQFSMPGSVVTDWEIKGLKGG